MPPSAYLKRALALGRTELPLFAAAFACLAATSAASLTLPQFTGTILDCVFRAESAAFRRGVALLAAYSAASGFFGGVKSLCFSVVGRRLAFTVRVQLFRAVLAQARAPFRFRFRFRF